MIKKGVSNTLPTHHDGDLDYTIMLFLSGSKGKRLGLGSIGKKLGRDKSSIKQRVVKLCKEGYTIKTSKYWALTTKGLEVLKGGYNIRGSENNEASTKWLHNDRQHDVKVIVDVVEKPCDDAWLTTWKPKTLRNTVFFTERIHNIFTTYTGKSLMFQLPPIYAQSPEHAQAEVSELVKLLIDEYEKKVVGLKLGNKTIKATVISQSHAIPNDPIATWCRKQDLWYRDNVINIDASEKPELETVDKKESHIHLDRYVKHIEDIMVKDVPKISELTIMLKMMQSQAVHNSKQLGVLIESQKLQVSSMDNLIKLHTPIKKSEVKLERPNYVM